MEKLEKVIKGFDICKNLDGSCDGCPYFDNELGENSCMREHLMPDAIELLKEQQPKKVKDFQYLADLFIGKCPSCGEELNNEVYPAFCGFCGQRISWKDCEQE